MIKRLFLSLGVLIISAQCAYSLDVVYPKKFEVVINSPSTFFVGSSNTPEELTINGEVVNVHSSGGFAKSVPLNFGENIFTLKSNEETLIYKIIRPKTASVCAVRSDFIQYKEDKYLKVLKDNMPLRSTPIDDGINRLAHLQKDTPLISDGENNNFYRVKLGKDTYGWILKSHVTLLTEAPDDIQITGADISEDDEFYIYTFHLTGVTPWASDEGADTLKVTLYNISNFSNNSYNIILPIKELMGGKNLLGYTTGFSGNDFIVKIRKPLTRKEESPLKGLTIAIDAGHGGSEIGAIGCLGDLEKDINLNYAKDLAAVLKNKGANVVLIRDKDELVGLNERISKANNENSVIFISLHGNALPDSLDPIKNKGIEIYYYYPQTKPLAQSIMSSMVNQTGTLNHGVIQRSFAVVRNTNALSILIELGYLINPEDNANILNSQFRKKSVNAIVDGLENYLTTQM